MLLLLLVIMTSNKLYCDSLDTPGCTSARTRVSALFNQLWRVTLAAVCKECVQLVQWSVTLVRETHTCARECVSYAVKMVAVLQSVVAAVLPW